MGMLLSGFAGLSAMAVEEQPSEEAPKKFSKKGATLTKCEESLLNIQMNAGLELPMERARSVKKGLTESQARKKMHQAWCNYFNACMNNTTLQSLYAKIKAGALRMKTLETRDTQLTNKEWSGKGNVGLIDDEIGEVRLEFSKALLDTQTYAKSFLKKSKKIEDINALYKEYAQAQEELNALTPLPINYAE